MKRFIGRNSKHACVIKKLSLQMKHFLNSCYMHLVRQHNGGGGGILDLVQILAVIPTNSASCERGFSCLTRVKSKTRNKNMTTSLNSLMQIEINGGELQKFNPDEALNVWLGSGERSRHVDGHSLWKKINRTWTIKHSSYYGTLSKFNDSSFKT